MKRIVLMFLVMTLLISCVGCGGGSDSSTTDTDTPVTKEEKKEASDKDTKPASAVSTDVSSDKGKTEEIEPQFENPWDSTTTAPTEKPQKDTSSTEPSAQGVKPVEAPAADVSVDSPIPELTVPTPAPVSDEAIPEYEDPAYEVETTGNPMDDLEECFFISFTDTEPAGIDGWQNQDYSGVSIPRHKMDSSIGNAMIIETTDNYDGFTMKVSSPSDSTKAAVTITVGVSVPGELYDQVQSSYAWKGTDTSDSCIAMVAFDSANTNNMKAKVYKKQSGYVSCVTAETSSYVDTYDIIRCLMYLYNCMSEYDLAVQQVVETNIL